MRKRKMLSVVLVLAMLLSCVACSSGGSGGSESTTAATEAASESVTEPASESVTETAPESSGEPAETEAAGESTEEASTEGTGETEADDEYLPGYYKPPHVTDGQYPISEEGVKLTYWIPISAYAVNFISNYDENPSYQKMQEDTGVDIEFIHPAVGGETEGFKTMLMSGEMPDMIQMGQESAYDGGLEALYEDGAIVDLTPYLDEFAPQYKEVINYSKESQKQIIKDGKVLGFYKITHADALPWCRMSVNKDWLDEFGMSEPATISEYEAYFQAILDNKPGVTPLWFNMSSLNTQPIFMGAFDILPEFYMKDEKTVDYYLDAPGYKDYLELMHSWYEKGYLSRDFNSLTGSEAQQLFGKGKLGAIVDSVDNMLQIAKDNNFAMTSLPYMRKEEDSVVGCRPASFPVDPGLQEITVITTACEDVEAAVQYLNYGYTFEGSLPFNFGVEGEAWNWDEDGFPQFTDLMLNNPDGMTAATDVNYVLKGHLATRYTYPDDITATAYASDPAALELRKKWLDDEHEQDFLRLPPVTLTAEESQKQSELLTQIQTYSDEMKLKFITGEEELNDASFDAFVAECENRGLADVIAIEQAAVDRYLAE